MKDTDLKETISGIRIVLYVASFLVLSVSFSLFLFPEKTDVYFSWTINSPLTAAFLGAGYLASFLLEFLSARETIWARARSAVPGVWTFTFLTLIIPLVHLERFHFGSPRFVTQAGTWVWLAIYIGVPLAMGVLWAAQIRQPGVDPPRRAPLAGWMRAALVVQGTALLLVGSAMILLPEVAIPLWPWKLSVLTSQAVGAWGVGIGVLALQASWENDLWRLRPFVVSYALYGALQVINLLRYPNALEWSDFSAVAYAIFLVSVLLAGGYGTWTVWRMRSDGVAA